MRRHSISHDLASHLPFLALSPPDLFSAPSGIPLAVNVNESEDIGSVVGVGIEEEEVKEEENTDGFMHDVDEGPSHDGPNFVLVEPVQQIQLNQMKK